MRERFSDPRLWCLAGASFLVAVALVLPPMKFQRNVFDIIAVVDITGSMNTLDMSAEGRQESRLEAAKRAVSQLLADLPCRSRLGLGIFTERRSFLLFAPVEVCRDFAPVETAVANLDWRMGWEGDSYVAQGLYSALEISKSAAADIVFLTDGQEAPPLPPGTGLPPFEGEIGRVKGVIAGVGGREKVPIPKFDDEGREAGVYGPQDVVQENRSGPPPPDAEKRPGYHPKWAPFGNGPPEGDEHLTSVRFTHLERLAGVTGLAYAELSRTPALVNIVMREAKPRGVVVAVDIRPYVAGGALILLVALYAAPLLAWASSLVFTPRSGLRS
ncbi:MAG: vWA domain-containing protein [Hyphomicrobium sp.]|jgi:mxaL protein